MKILLTGATGYIGSAVRTALIERGHEVTALVRSSAASAVVSESGASAVTGDVGDAALVRELAGKNDGVIHLAAPGPDVEASFAEAVLAASPEVFIRTGGVWVHGPGEAITEDTPRAAPALVAWREAIDLPVLAAPGVRSVLIEPGIVYGHGKGIPGLVVGAAQSGTFIGDGSQHWTTVHVDDLAALYVLALEKASAGSVFLGVGGDNPTARELGEAADRRLGLGGRVGPEDPARTIARLGDFGAALLVSQQAGGEKARRVLGWQPSRPSLISEIAAGGYDPS
ncbi:NAD-dependent epimerase/dehydratase family protein [Actinoplanes sp. OR16]|uniref:NAD-dependent epimerase/dehydratase family protein n=1 Tax=Actinoplanes sp. OR16 TaxID=946334 RepID=UPI000FDB2A49|nr:NAD-dependent epimerase/dehydratase family protein [Actinoplanes sp. OR16]